MARKISHIATLTALLALPVSASDLVTSEDLRLVPNGLLGADGAGYAVDIDGDTLVIGAHGHPAAGSQAGAAFVYRNIGGTWTQEAKLIGSHTTGGDAFGDGFGTSCPCSWDNFSPGNGGCLNSTVMGGLLVGEGSASVASDDLQLIAANLPPGKPALLFHGTTDVNGGLGNVLGAGLLCVGGNISRVTVAIPDADGYASWGPGLFAAEGLGIGDTPQFQVWYRDSTHFCAGFNLTNGYRVTLGG